MSKYLITLALARKIHTEYTMLELTDSEKARANPAAKRKRLNSQGGEINALMRGAYAYRQYWLKHKGFSGGLQNE